MVMKLVACTWIAADEDVTLPSIHDVIFNA